MARALLLSLATTAWGKELLVPLPSGGSLGLSTRGPSAFRLRLLPEDHAPIDTPMVNPDEPDAPFKQVGSVGISSSFGSVKVLKNGAVQLRDAKGAVITTTEPLGTKDDLCSVAVGMDVTGHDRVAPPQTVADQGACCDACKAADGCTDWVFALPGNELPEGNCWLLTNVTGRMASNTRMLGAAGSTSVSFSSGAGRLYGRGAGHNDGTKLTVPFSTPYVENLFAYAPHYYSTDGYAALGVVDSTIGNGKTNFFPASYASDGKRISWSYQGAFELYLMPAATLDAGTQAYYSLIGAPRVPPRYAFGFIASRWGWEDKDYIETTLGTFRSGKYPIDAFIGDFEWFTNKSDYDFDPAGFPWYKDFGYNPVTFPDPVTQLAHYKDDLKIRFGGIRKPRLGGTEALDFARSKGWLFAGDEMLSNSLLQSKVNSPRYAHNRNLNYSIPEVRQWYAEQTAHYETDGVSFFWNDEGETDYFTFYWWNVAQVAALKKAFPERRFYSLNRAFTPGMARLGATVWTGDVNPTWDDLRTTPGMVLNWGMAGAPYVGCDIGGFTGETQAELLTRWYQVGIFMPTMRVHSVNTATPHFPWLWPQAYDSAMKKALELRYRLLPYHYSLAHTMFSSRRLWMRPLAAEFPEDPKVADLSSQWLDGRLLVAPVLNNESARDVYLPKGTWFTFNDVKTTVGPTTLGGTAAIDEVPVFVPAGSLVPLAPIVQSTEDLPGGPLEVQVYAGADCSFTVVEDDGESISYESGKVRTVHFEWSEGSKTLSWTVKGDSRQANKTFTQVFATLFEAGAAAPSKSKVAVVGKSGSISWSVYV